MSKRALLSNLAKVYCRIQPSGLHGVGVFAVRRIPKGINPFELPNEPKLVDLTPKDLKTLAPGIRKMIRDYVVNQEGRYVMSTVGLNLVELEFFVNHSNSPNLIFDEQNGCYRTARAIKPSEELTANYNTYAPTLLHSKR